MKPIVMVYILGIMGVVGFISFLVLLLQDVKLCAKVPAKKSSLIINWFVLILSVVSVLTAIALYSDIQAQMQFVVTPI